MPGVTQRSLFERLTTSPINYRAAFVIDWFAAAVCGWIGIRQWSGEAIPAALLVVAGVALWSLGEYVLHRWLFHGPFAAIRREHARHHQHPRALISSPFMVMPSLALAVWTTVAVPFSASVAALVTFGLYLGYNYYALVHHLQHFHPELLSRWSVLEGQLRLHELHHRQPSRHFGISSSIWDRAFGTDVKLNSSSL